MAQPQRSDVDQRGPALPQRAVEDRHYDAGGHIAQLQAELAQRLAAGGVDQRTRDATPSGERAVRFASVTGGYLALLAGYAVAALLILQLF